MKAQLTITALLYRPHRETASFRHSHQAYFHYPYSHSSRFVTLTFLPSNLEAIDLYSPQIRQAISWSHSLKTIQANPLPPADLVQELYVKELKAYKTPALKATDSEGHVQKFAAPKAPKSPEETDIANELKAYEASSVEVEGQGEPGSVEKEVDWFEEEPEEEHAAH